MRRAYRRSHGVFIKPHIYYGRPFNAPRWVVRWRDPVEQRTHAQYFKSRDEAFEFARSVFMFWYRGT